MKRLLMIAFHFPPYGMSSGVQRTTSFTRYLPSNGWEPIVLTASTRAYNAVASESVQLDVNLTRAFALDTVRHLGIAGKYPGLLALPDRWISWFPAAVVSGLKLIYKYRPQAIWSTYPIATAHLIAYALQRITGLPWVADFRDPMLDDIHPAGRAKRYIYRWIEQKAVKHATICCFTTPGAIRAYQACYLTLTDEKCRVVSNGYDEHNFLNQPVATKAKRKSSGKLRLLHSGALYPLERNPTCFFRALSIMLQDGVISSDTIEILLRATGHDGYIHELIDHYKLNELITLLPSIGHTEALAEMCAMDGLLLLQAENCNQQIPAKVYEYLRSGKPLFAMTDSRGDTAQLLRSVGVESIAPLDDTQQIIQEFGAYIEMLMKRGRPLFNMPEIALFSREHRTVELAAILDEIG